MLYEADASGGLDEWDVSGGWQHFQGMLVNDGADSSIVAPYEPSLSNYAIEAEIQVVNFGRSFGLILRDGAVQATAYGGGAASITVEGKESQYEGWPQDREWHTYRLEVQGNTARFLVDGSPVTEMSDNRLLSGTGGSVGLWVDGGFQLNVRSFKVIAL